MVHEVVAHKIWFISITKTGSGTTTFAYDASGQRVKAVKPDGTIIYTPFPQFEEEVRPDR